MLNDLRQDHLFHRFPALRSNANVLEETNLPRHGVPGRNFVANTHDVIRIIVRGFPVTGLSVSAIGRIVGDGLKTGMSALATPTCGRPIKCPIS
jgi:hypothetical protein